VEVSVLVRVVALVAVVVGAAIVVPDAAAVVGVEVVEDSVLTDLRLVVAEVSVAMVAVLEVDGRVVAVGFKPVF